MDLTTTTYIVVGLSFALYIGIAIWARAGSTSEFYVAGGGVHPVTNGMATAADWMSAASFISMAGLIAGMGYGGGLFLMGWTGGYVLLAMLLAPYLRKFGKFTVPQFIGDRFYSKTAATIAVVCLLTASITYIIGQMTGVGVAFSRFLEVSNATGIYVGMALVFVYAVFGGMKGITYTQVAQYIVLILAYTVPAVFISLQLTGNPIPQLGLGSNLVGTDVSLLSKLDQIVSDLGFAEYTTSVPGSKLNMFVYTLSLMIGTAGLPHVIIRFFTVPKVSDARSSAGWALVFIALVALLVVPEAAPLRNPKTGGIIPSPFIQGIVPLIILFFFVISVPYGMVTKQIRSASDVPDLLVDPMKSMAGFIVMVFPLSQFVAFFNWSNMGKFMAIGLTDVLENLGMTGIPAFLGLIFLSALLCMFIASGSAIWSILAPIFVPMFMLLGFHPAFAQIVFRVADSSVIPLAPMSPFVPLFLGFLQRYIKEAKLGTYYSLVLPYPIVFFVVWLLMLVGWYLLGLPIGPGVYPHL